MHVGDVGDVKWTLLHAKSCRFSVDTAEMRLSLDGKRAPLVSARGPAAIDKILGVQNQLKKKVGIAERTTVISKSQEATQQRGKVFWHFGFHALQKVNPSNSN